MSVRLVAGPNASMTAAVLAFYVTALPKALTYRAVCHLADELGGMGQARDWLIELVSNGVKPIGVNIARSGGGSQTLYLAPLGWTKERLAGHVATMRGDVEAH